MTQTVLIIDNSGDALKTAQALMDQGFSVLAAPGAHRAAKMIASIQPALIIADTSVAPDPVIWVKEAARLEIPAQVIALTPQPDFSQAMEWVAEGVYTVLAKPIDGEKLRRAAQAAMETCETFRACLAAAPAVSANALADFYRGLAGQLDLSRLKTYIVDSLKSVTGARRVDLELSSAFPDSALVENQPAHAPSGPISDGGGLKCRLGFDLNIGAVSLGELFLYFREKSDLTVKDRTVMLEIVHAISLALSGVSKYQKAVNLAARDGLTGLYNRRIFNEVLKREFAAAKRHSHHLSLLSLDLDHFKSVNDNFGHQTGDMILKAVARLIAQVARHTDLPARVGGEEFAIILPHTNQEQAFFVAQRLKTILEESAFDLNGAVFHQTISQGVADIEHFMVNSPEDMVYWADQALYLAKREGRDTIRLATDLSITPVTKDGPYAFQ